MLTPELKKRIDSYIRDHKVFVFMKGEKDNPMCGFSALTATIFKKTVAEFETFNVLKDPEMRQAIKEYTNWPTVPQVFINGKFVGGSDILQELHQSGELEKIISQ